MLTTILTSPLFQPVLGTIITGLVTTATLAVVHTLSVHRKTQALAAVADAFGQALQAAALAAGANLGKPTPQVAALAWVAARQHILTSWPTIEKSLKIELDTLLGSHAAMATSASAAIIAQQDPRLATFNLPAPGAPPAKSAGFGLIILMAAVIALAALLGVAVAAHAETMDLSAGAPESAVLQGGDPLPGQSEPAFALGGAEGGMIRLAPVQVENPVVIDHWIVGILCPGLRFDLKGAAPAAVAAGSGVSFNYIFGKYVYTSPNNVQHPWFGVSLFAQGAVNIAPGSLASTTETGAVGAGIIILNYVVFGWIVDLLAGGVNGPSGILAGQMSLSNFSPVILTSIPLP